MVRYELWVAIYSKRALAIIGAYLAFALLGSLAYVSAVDAIQDEVLATLVARGADPAQAAATLELAEKPAFQKILAFFVGSEATALAPPFRSSVLTPAFFWGSLAFLPFLIVLTGFDAVARDLASRSICYTTLRLPRRSIVLAKLGSHLLLVMIIVLASVPALLLVAHWRLDGLQMASACVRLLWACGLLLPYVAFYTGLAGFASCSVRSPFGALFVALATMFLLWVCGWMAQIPETSNWAWLRSLRWLSPSTYQSGLWQADWSTLTRSIAAYLGLAMAFVAAGSWRVETMDL